MTRSILLFALALVLPVAANAGSFDITGSRGGTLQGTWTCQPGTGQWTCGSQSVVTRPNGKTGDRSRDTVIAPGQITTTLNGTRANGRTFSRTGTWSR